MGSRRPPTEYFCDFCGITSVIVARVDGCLWMRNRHGGSPPQEWNICDECDRLAYETLTTFIKQRLGVMSGKYLCR
jgi:hypothetical protein